MDPDGHDPDPEPQETKPLPVPAIWPFTMPPKEVTQAVHDGATAIGNAAKDLGRDAVKAIQLVSALVTVLTHPADTATTTATPPSPQVQPIPPPPITMGKGSTKDQRKVNQGRAGSAKAGADAARADRDRLRALPNKTPGDKEALRRAERELQRQIDRMRKSEPHGRKPEYQD